MKYHVVSVWIIAESSGDEACGATSNTLRIHNVRQGDACATLNSKARWHERRVAVCVVLPASVEVVVVARIRERTKVSTESMHRNKITITNPNNNIIVLRFRIVESDVERIGYLCVRITER